MFSKLSKVKFQDNGEDDYVLENSVLKSKLQSKIAALSIMSKELDKCAMERDKYKLLVEQFNSQKVVLNESTTNPNQLPLPNTVCGSEILAKTKDHNYFLTVEVELLKSKLDEANGDIIALRKQFKDCNIDIDKIYCTDGQIEEYEKLLQDLEQIQKNYQQIQMDYSAALDQKEDLVSDCDFYKSKVQCLNHQMHYILNGVKTQDAEEADNQEIKICFDAPVIDIEALVAENKKLHERVAQLEVENELLTRNATKYKTLLDNKEKFTMKFKKGITDIMTYTQVREYLHSENRSGHKRGSAADLKSLCVGLLEALSDKSIMLKHQRKTNQILADRIAELEKILESWSNGLKCIPIFPSQMLIDEVLKGNSSVKSDENKDKKKADEPKIVQSSIQQVPVKTEVATDTIEDKVGSSEEAIKEPNITQTFVITPEIILPKELEDLVNEALAEMQSSACSNQK